MAGQADFLRIPVSFMGFIYEPLSSMGGQVPLGIAVVVESIRSIVCGNDRDNIRISEDSRMTFCNPKSRYPPSTSTQDITNI